VVEYLVGWLLYLLKGELLKEEGRTALWETRNCYWDFSSCSMTEISVVGGETSNVGLVCSVGGALIAWRDKICLLGALFALWIELFAIE